MHVGAILLIASIVMSAIESTRSVNEDLLWLYRLFPIYSLGEALVGTSRESGLARVCACLSPPVRYACSAMIGKTCRHTPK